MNQYSPMILGIVFAMHMPLPRLCRVLGEFPVVEQRRKICTLAFHRRVQDTPGDITPSKELSK